MVGLRRWMSGRQELQLCAWATGGSGWAMLALQLYQAPEAGRQRLEGCRPFTKTARLISFEHTKIDTLRTQLTCSNKLALDRLWQCCDQDVRDPLRQSLITNWKVKLHPPAAAREASPMAEPRARSGSAGSSPQPSDPTTNLLSPTHLPSRV